MPKIWTAKYPGGMDAVPEEDRESYALNEAGEAVLQVKATGGLELVDATALHAALDAERGTKRKLEKYGDVTPEAAKQAVARVAELERKIQDGAATSQDAIDAALAEQGRKHAAELETFKAANGKLESIVSDRGRESAARAALRAGGFTASEEAMVANVLPNLRMARDSDGNLTDVVEVVDARTGHTRRTGTAGESRMTPAELVAELREDPRFAKLADGPEHRGGGLNPDGSAAVIGSAPTVISGDLTADGLEAIATGQAVRAQ